MRRKKCKGMIVTDMDKSDFAENICPKKVRKIVRYFLDNGRKILYTI